LKNLCLVLIAFLFASCQSINNIGALVPPTVDEDRNLPSQRINIAGVDRLVHLRTFGNTQNPPLFVLHGSYTDSRPYRTLCEKLSEKYFVVLWDQRGCGLSERISAEEFTLKSAIEEINAIKEIFAKDKKISIIGHSWGGGIASLYTSEFPENIEQLVLIQSMPLNSVDMNLAKDEMNRNSYFSSAWNDMARHGISISSRKNQQFDYRALQMLRSHKSNSVECENAINSNWKVHRIGGLIEWKRSQLIWSKESGFDYDFTKGLKKYNQKVLIIAGECGNMSYEFQKEYTRKHFQNVEVIKIKNGGHRFILEQENETMETLKSYLKEFK